MTKTIHLGHALDLAAFRDGAEAGLKSVAVQAATRREAAPAKTAGANVVQATLDAIQAIRRISGEVRLSAEERLHYLRCVRINLAAAEDRLAGVDDLPPCIAEKFGDITHSIHHAAANPED